MADRNAARSATEKMYYTMNKMHCGMFYERGLVAMVKLVGDGGFTVPKAYEALKMRPRLFQLWTMETFGMKPAELIHMLLDKKPVQTLKHFEVAKYVQLSPEIVRKIIPVEYACSRPELFENDVRWLFGALRGDGTGMLILRGGQPAWFNYAITNPDDYVELVAAHPNVYKEIDKRNLTSLLATITE